MYYSKIEAAAVVDHRALYAAESEPTIGAKTVGLTMLMAGLPLFAAYAFLWGVARSLRGLIRLGGSMGQAAIEAARK